MITRLADPKKVAASPRQFHELAEKISACITRLCRQPANGGNPFLFALAAPKPHELSDHIPTAATDGKKFYWNPEWLESMTPDQVSTIMLHESYHVLFSHCAPERAGGLNHKIWNLAVDYSVNSVILTDHTQSGRVAKIPRLFDGVLGTPIPLDHYLEWIAGKRDTLPSPGCMADETVYGRSPESMYDQIQKALLSSPRRCKEAAGGCGAMSFDPKTGESVHGPGPYPPENCQVCGEPQDGSGIGYGAGSLDDHMAPAQTKDETMADMMRASEQARAMSGNKDTHSGVPGAIEDLIRAMGRPELSARDIIRGICSAKKVDAGNTNDWKHIRRRPTWIYEKNAAGVYEPRHRHFIPKKTDYVPKWIALLDTSGSMSVEDQAAGMKELKILASDTEGWVVPGDVAVDWSRLKRVRSNADVESFDVKGGGGTEAINPFLAEYHKYVPNPDLIIILSDGYIENVPDNLRPTCDLVVILTDPQLDLKEYRRRMSFGRVCRLKRNDL